MNIEISLIIDGEQVKIPPLYEAAIIRNLKKTKASVRENDVKKMESQISFYEQEISKKRKYLDTLQSKLNDHLKYLNIIMSEDLEKFCIENYAIKSSNLLKLIEFVESSDSSFINNPEVREFFEHPKKCIQSKIIDLFRIFLPEWHYLKSRGYYGFRKRKQDV